MTKTRIHRLGGGETGVYESVLMQNCHDYSINLMLIFTCTYSASPLQGTNFVVWRNFVVCMGETVGNRGLFIKTIRFP